MKKAVIAVAALAAAAGISIGSFLAVKNSSEKKDRQKEESLAENVLFSMNSDDISQITITIDGESYSVRHEDKDWILTDCPGDTFEPNPNKFQAICTYIAGLTAQENYGALTDEIKHKYGLDDPYIITVSDGTQENTLYIGDISPTGNFYYAYTDSRKNVFTIPEDRAGYILADPIDLRSDSLLPYTDNDISGIEVKRKGKTVYTLSLDSETGLWSLPDEYSMLTVNQARPSSILTVITRLSAEAMYPQSPDDIKTFGFDDPDAELIVTAKDGTQKHVLIRYYGKDAKTYVHVYLKESAQTETYYTADFSFVDYDIIDLILQKIECGNMYGVSRYKISCPELSEEFASDPSEGKVECRGTVIDLNNAEIKSFYETFFNSFAYIMISGIDTKAEPELEEPLFSAEYTSLDGNVRKIDLTDAGNGKAYVFVNGEYTGTLTDTDFISGDNSMISAYEVLCRHAGLEPQNN